jgi:mono/diheme cytochrome c family protein
MKSIMFCSVVTLLLFACSEKPLDTSMSVAVVKATPDNWQLYQRQKIQKKAQYLKDHQTAYDWFADFAFSESDGVPYILLRLLPVIAPEIWGSEDNFLEVIGLFNDERQQGYPMPRGIGISALSRKDPFGDIDYTSFTCAACHIGRVAGEGNRIEYIDGGVNTEFNIVLYRVKVYQTLQKVFKNESDKSKQNLLIRDAFLAALDSVQSKNSSFFYRGYENRWVNLDENYEKQQIDLFKTQATQHIDRFSQRAINEYKGYGALLDKNYSEIKSRAIKGYPGMADATGISAVNGYIDLKEGILTQYIASFVLPTSPGMTDFMSVWEQDKREAEWDGQHKQLINGGGQWNGNIPIPMYRNLAAQLTLGLEKNDLRVAAFGVELLGGLPATVYPFDVDITLAKKGEALFTQHCADCHQPHNGKVYDSLNVNLDRSYVVNWIIRKGGISGFYNACNPETNLDMPGQPAKLCAEYKGVSLEGKKDLIMSDNGAHHGYNARPLSGIWAQAPYLHTGSVPTMYHLLVPSERPDSFIKSRLDYDQQRLGFAWQEANIIQKTAVHSYRFDTTSFSTFSNVGHDTDISDNGKTYKLDWSDDKEGVWALIEYLKTL